ncbi:hypothetical protein AAU01_05420 [Paenarthrobacter aurescens]|uniref:Uncharacterized protein n=1 Tax=Paenarthrobacter aurescens TaxID=43663 RepID=A0A4Y3N9A5_PAEAU|nr:hypothetical protein AAU01_05420 [Paenarthrobacter aurescens]
MVQNDTKYFRVNELERPKGTLKVVALGGVSTDDNYYTVYMLSKHSRVGHGKYRRRINDDGVESAGKTIQELLHVRGSQEFAWIRWDLS